MSLKVVTSSNLLFSLPTPILNLSFKNNNNIEKNNILIGLILSKYFYKLISLKELSKCFIIKSCSYIVLNLCSFLVSCRRTYILNDL